ncbi:MAG: hypothetical protein WD648_04560 [Planctomycetaceae bacterium]
MSDGIRQTCCHVDGRARRQTVHKAAVAVGAAGILIGFVIFGSRGTSEAAKDSAGVGNRPQDVVASMIAAAQRGDFQDSATSESQALRFMHHVYDQRSELTGHVVSDVSIANDSAASLVLELVYRRDNERYKFELKRVRDGWKVVELTPVDRYSPEIPYGTPVDR